MEELRKGNVALTAGTILIIKPGFFATEYKQCNRI
jgi:hypothetical protein